jgi:hypothetical protein
MVLFEAFFSTARKFKNWAMHSSIVGSPLVGTVVGAWGGAIIGAVDPACPQ